jgi:hypothetical protein
MVGQNPIKINEGKSFDPIPEDKYQVQIYDVEAVMVTNTFKQVEEERLRYTFIVLDPDKTMPGISPEGTAPAAIRGRRLWARFSKTLSIPGSTKPSNLTKLVSAVYGRELAKPELETWEPEDIIGKQVCVMVSKEVKGENVYNNILSYSKANALLEPWVDKDGDHKKEATVKKSQPAVADSFEKDMDELAAKHKKEV